MHKTTRLTASDIIPVKNGRPSPITAREKAILDIAESLSATKGVVGTNDIAARLKVSASTVSHSISRLREKNRWPYPRTCVHEKPSRAVLEAAVPATESKPPRFGTAVFRAMLDALNAVDALPNEARAALVAYLIDKG